MHLLENNTEKQGNKNRNKLFVVIGTVAILLIAATAYFASRFTNEGNAQQEYNDYLYSEPNETAQPINEEEISDDYDYIIPVSISAEQVRNLQKLAMVWGFTKYTHSAFLTGERCWDEELLALIPIVRFANEDDVNDILYNWFIGLGDDGYDLDYSAFRSVLLEDFSSHRDMIMDFFEDTNNHNWPSVEGLYEELWLLSTGFEMNLRPMADLSWINKDYLGMPLATALSRFNKVQATDMSMAPMAPMTPMYFDAIDGRLSVFTNKNGFVYMDYEDCYYRLLGLFRLWNTMKYFFPYIDILDYEWNALLSAYIVKMLDGTDRFSYEATITMMASNLRDAHIRFYRVSAVDLVNFFYFSEQPRGLMRFVIPEILDSLFGLYFAPISLQEAEGRLVVSDIHRDIPELRIGDVILRVNDTDIVDITAGMLRYLPYPNTEKALAFLVRDYAVLRQHSSATPMIIDVYRFGEEISISFNTVRRNYTNRFPIVSDTHMLVENNIGLINPSQIEIEESYGNSVLRDILNEFESLDVNGLIIDLRQFPSLIAFLIADYLLDEAMHCFTMSEPFWPVPGAFIDYHQWYAGDGRLHTFFYVGEDVGSMDRLSTSFFHNINTVVLMNEHTQSRAETMVMALMGGDNVTVMGTNSIGANGNVTFLPLPGGITMMFTGLGINLPDGGQTQRIGLSPDIYVPRTIEAIREGRDELMEAAIEFLLELMR